MADRKPLIVDAGQLKQLQGGDDLDIPLEDRVAMLESAMRSLVTYMLAVGLEPPAEVVALVEVMPCH